jgi:hypothetical protein
MDGEKIMLEQARLYKEMLNLFTFVHEEKIQQVEQEVKEDEVPVETKEHINNIEFYKGTKVDRYA